MKRVYKYNLIVCGKQYLSLPVGSVILSVAVQCNLPVLYALVDTTISETETYYVNVLFTGVDCNEQAEHFVGTLQIESLVLHVFVKAVGR